LKSCSFNKISNQPRVLVTDFSSSNIYDENDSSDYAGDSDDDI